MTVETTVVWALRIASGYLLVGILFAFAFVAKGAGKIDPVAKHGTWGFRVLIFPGVVAFWPLLLSRWVRGVTHPPPECNAHRNAARKEPA